VGIPDFRLESDRYLDLHAERAKAERLAVIAETTSLAGLSQAYYDMTYDVDPQRCKLFLKHILGSIERSELLADGLTSNGRTLEIGCGTGGLLVAATRRGIAIEGVDIASRWLVVARRRLSDFGLRVPLTACEAEHLPWSDQTFATIVADSVIEHCDDPLIALKEWLRVLKPNGRLLLWSPNRYTIGPDPHVRLWGVGFLLRPWAEAYVKLRRGGAWLPKTLSAYRAISLLKKAGFQNVKATPVPIQGPWAATRPAWQRILIQCYELLRKFCLTKQMILWICPLWQVEATR
jgi:ubiquinone/menaquinone biosynthesis C-methylase UbiE